MFLPVVYSYPCVGRMRVNTIHTRYTFRNHNGSFCFDWGFSSGGEESDIHLSITTNTPRGGIKPIKADPKHRPSITEVIRPITYKYG